MLDGGSEEGGYEGEPQGFGFGLLELGRCVMRLPGEVVSEELPRLRDLILPVRRDLSCLLDVCTSTDNSSFHPCRDSSRPR